MSEKIVKTWTVNAVSEGETPLRLLCDGRLVTQVLPGTLDQVSPVQYLLLSVAGCFALSCRAVLKKRTPVSWATVEAPPSAGAPPSAEAPTSPIPNFEVSVTGDKLEGDGNRLARISVTTQFHGMTETDAAATLRAAKALCTVTNTLSGSPAIHYAARSGLHPTAASGQASGQGVDFDVEGRFSRR